MGLILTLFVSISSASAIDIQQDENLTLITQENNVIEISNDNIQTDKILSLSDDNATLKAANSDNDVLGTGSKSDLSNLISNAPYYGATVYLDDDYLFTSSGAISIYKYDFVIDGQGHTIDANGLSRIFTVGSSYSNITFKNIVFKNAYASGNGGAIDFEGTNLTIINCTFESNYASGSGGSVFVQYHEGSVTNIYNSSFTKNTANSGGALYFNNPSNQQHACYVNIENSSFTENSVDYGSLGGGAIYIHRSYQTTIRSSKFTRNSALGLDGGAIRYSGSTMIYDSEFYENTATHGGALCFGQAVDLGVFDSIFVNNSALSEGGSIKARFLEVDNVDFINSTASKGGAIFSRSGTATVQNVNIDNASATQGGSLFISGDVNNFAGSNIKITNSNAVEGGAIYSNAGGSMSIMDSSINNASADYGGSIYVNQGKATITGTTIENSNASIEGGAVYVNSNNNVEIKDSLLKNNTAPIGGAVYWSGDNGKISNTNFVSNDGTNGSSVYWAGNNGIVEKSTFDDENVTTGSIHWTGDNGQITGNTMLTDKGIYLSEDSSNVTLKQNTELAPEGGSYSVYIGNTTNLIENNFNNLIENHGKILTPIYIVTLNNMTIMSDKDSATVYTAVIDDNGNYLDIIKNLVNVYNSQNLTTTFNGTHFVSTISNIEIGEHRVTSLGYDVNDFANLTVQSGGILYLLLNLTVNQTNYGETVTITFDVVNTTYNGTVDIALNDVHYNATLINGTAVLVLHNLAPNTYDIVASFIEYNQTLSTDVEIKVVLRNSTINITATNAYYGNATTITVNTTNGTTGEVFLFVNNKMYTIKLVNSTGQYNLTGLAGGNYTVFAFYNGDVLFSSSYNETSFSIYKYDNPINITVKDIYVGQIATIKVDFPNDINGKIYIDINDKEYVYYNRTSVTIYESDLPAGNVTVRAYHDGNEKYYANNTVTYFNVTKKNMTISIQTADIVVGENATISVIIPADAKGIVLLNVNGTRYFEYANGTVAKFVISGLAKGLYNVTAAYYEGPVYNYANATSSFNVNYVRAYDFNVSASVDNDLNVLVDISLPKDIDGDVLVEINGTNYTASMSKGKDIVIISGLLSGEYNGTVYFANDSKYESSKRTFIVDLERVTPTINVIYNHTIYVDDDAIIKVTIDSDATGNITISLNNNNYTQKIENGVATFNITGLPWNSYQFNVTFAGDRKYLPGQKEHTLEVSRIHNYYSYLETHDIFVGENATIRVTFENDTTGTVTLIINGSTHIITLENGTGSINISGLPVGKHVINATYSGDRKYEPCNRIFEDFHVKKLIDYDFVPSGETNDTHANITVTLPADADGHVNITVNGQTYNNIEVINGKANLTVGGLTAGTQYPVKVDYSGNDKKYEPASRNITLNSAKTLDYHFTVVGDSIHVGDIAHIIINLPEATDGDRVVVKVENITGQKNAFIINGTVNVTVVSNELKEGEYHVTVEYEGNDKYESSTKYTYIYVSKISSFRFDVVTNEPYVGQNLTVDIRLPDDTTGNVTVTVSINNTNYTANVTNGSAHVDIPDLPAGVYNTTVYYSGDDKYHSAVKTVEVIVEKVDEYEFTVTPVDIYVGQNETIKIVLPKDINGNVTIRVYNTTYVNQVVNVVNGTGWFNITGLAQGQYVAYVTLYNDSKYEDDTVFANFKVSLVDDYLFEVNVTDENYVRDNITFTVKLPENATGNVTVTIFGRDYQGVVENGNATVNITAPYYGTFPYRVSFEETGKYAFKSQTGSVVISKKDVDLNPIYDSQVHVGENVTFKVQLPKDATGTITVITRMVTYTVALVNGSANITVPGYPLAQSYSPSISYSGDDRYNANSTPLNVVVVKVSDYNLTFNVSDIHVGETEVVNITLPADATDDVLIYGNFSQRRYSQAIINGNVTFNIANLAAGTYNITVLYQGYDKYESKNVTKTFKVVKVNSTIAIELVNRTIVVSVPDDATGNVSISIGTIKENVTIVNGKATLDVSSLYPGDYLAEASFAGDDKYFANATSKTVTLPKVTDYTIIVVAESITVGKNATVIVKLPSDANGYANITVNNTVYRNVEVKDGNAKLNVTKLPVGTHSISVNYTDNKYAFNTNSTTVTVNQITTILTPSVSVDGRNVSVVVTINENATGNITVYVDNVPYSREIKDSKVNVTLTKVMPGDHIIQAVYNGDTNHTSAKTSLIVAKVEKISDYALIIDLTELITVAENNNVTVTFPEEAYGRVTINYNGEFINAEIDPATHTATVQLPLLKEGNYTVSVDYEDELYDYVKNSTNFTVIKLNTTVDVEVNDITKDLSEIINITINENATGNVLIDVNGTVYHRTLENGKTTLTLSGLNDGEYAVTVIYEGDDMFYGNSTSATFTVSKIPVSITINASDIIVGHVLAIKFNMSREITDLVTVQVGKTNYTTFAHKGNGSLNVYDLPVGEYNITVYYGGSEDYSAASNMTSISVTAKKASELNVSVEDITVGENITVYVNATQGIYGPVYVTIAGLAYTYDLVDGKVNFTVSGLIARDYTVSAFFMGNDEFDLSNDTSYFTVHKRNTPIDLVISNIDISQMVNITVKVPEQATGYVLININGTEFYANIVNGTANYTIPPTQTGYFVVNVTYLGDDKYLGNITNGSYTVNKIKTEISIAGENVTVGQSITFNITMNANLTEVVIVEIAGKNYTTFVENGNGSIIIYNLPENEYIATVYFQGNLRYAAVNNTTTVKVSAKKASETSVNVDSIFVGEDAVIFVNVTQGATGNVTIVVAGNAYTKALNNSKVNFTLQGLTARDYHVTAIYNGDEYYLSSSGTDEFTVNKKDTIINASASDIIAGEETEISVNVTDGATGVVLVDINGTKYYANLSNSKVILNVPNLAVGTYDVTVTYIGDDFFHSNETKTTFKVSKENSTIGIFLPDGEIYAYGDSVVIHLTGPKDVTGVAIVTVVTKYGHDNYTVYINDGEGELTLLKPGVDNYNVSAVYKENYKYYASNSSKLHFEVYMNGTDINVNAHDIDVGENETIVVTFPKGEFKGNVTFTIGENEYSRAITYDATTNTSTAILTLEGLASGSYHVKASFVYDDGERTIVYEGSDVFTVSKIESKIIINPISDIKVGENATITFEVSPSEATGNIDVYVNGKHYATVSVDNPILTVSNLGEGEVFVQAFYAGDNKYLSSNATSEFNVKRNYVPMDLITKDIDITQMINITVELPDDATGYVLLDINGTQFYADVVNGTANYIIPPTQAGHFVVNATYLGDNKYFANSTIGTYECYKISTDIVVSGNDIIVGQTEVLDIVLDANITEVVIVEIDGVNYTSFVEDGVGSFSISNLAADVYDVVVYFPGNTKYSAVSNKTTIKVSEKSPSAINVSVADITVGEDITVYVNATEGINGPVYVTIAGVAYTRELVNGKVNFTVSDLIARNYQVSAIFLGNEEFESCNATSTFVVHKKDTSIDLDVSDIKIGDDEIIKVTVDDDATGTVLINIDGLHVYADIVNGTAIANISDFAVGKYNVSVNYLGDDKYNGNSANSTFTVSQLETTIVIEGSDIFVGQTEVFDIVLGANITEVVIVEIGGVNYTTFVENGVGTLSISGLAADVYDVVVYFPGNTKYSAVDNTTTIKVSDKLPSAINVSVADIVVGEDITVYVNATEGINGPVYVTIAGVAYTYELVNGKVNFTVSNLTARPYTVSAFFMGNDEYELCNATSTFVVHKKDTSIDLDVSDIKIGEDEIIKVTVDGDATGTVLINIDGLHVYADIVNGTAIANISDFAVGKYNVSVSYLGDDKYNGNSANSTFTVSQLETTIVIEGSDIFVGQTEVFDIVLGANITEVVIVEIDGVNYTTFVEDGVGTLSISNLAADVYDVVVYFPGNTKYSAVDNTTTIKVSDKLPSAVTIDVSDIFVGDDLIINVNVTPGATGLVTVVVAGDTYTKQLTGDSAEFNISGLIARDYHVTAYYLGDDIYSASNSTANFAVNKKDTLINASANDILVGDETEISVNITEGATGVVLIDINGTKYYANISNSKVILNVPNLAVGEYDVTVTYLGDDFFHSNETKTTFKVSKVTSEITISLPDGEIYAYGDNVVIHLTGPKDVTGVAIVSVVSENGHDTYTVYINDGEGNLTIIKPDVDDYNVSAVYKENYKYYASNSSKLPFEVYMSGTELNVNGHNIDVDETETIVVTLPVGEYSGNITIYVDGRNFTVPIEYNPTTNISTATLTLDDLVSGTYTVKAVFVNEEEGKFVVHEGSDIFTVSKIGSTIEINPISDIKVGEDATITFNALPEDITGTIDVYVNSKHYTVDVTNPTLVVSDLKSGEVSVYAEYTGNNKYLASNATATFNVYKNDVAPVLNVEDIDITEMINVTVTLPEDATGYVLIDINGTQFYADVVNGTAKYLIPPTKTGSFVVTATYLGDDKYNSNSTVGSYICSKLDTDIVIVGKDIIVGNEEFLTITTSNFTEVVIVEIDGVNYTTFVENGIGNLSVSNLAVGTYNATVYFPGNTKYNAANSSTTFTVSDKKASSISIDANSILVGQDEIITVTVNRDATGNITIVIRGREYSEKIDNGVATFTISDLTARDYEVTAIYNGDENYKASEDTAKFTVSKLDLDIIVTAQNITAGDVENIAIELSEKESGIVLVNVDSTGYYVNVTDGRGALKLNHLAPGNYSVSAQFLGDDKYNAQSNVTSFTVKAITEDDIKVNIDPENKTITIEVPENATGNVTVVIDGKNVTGEVINNTIIVNITDLLPGNHTIEVIYGDKNYTVYDNTTEIEIPKVDDYEFDVGIDVDGDNVVISVDLPEDVNGVVLVDVDGTGYYMNVTNGTGKLVLSDLDDGEHNVSITYPGNEKYAEVKNSTSFNVSGEKKLDLDIIVTAQNITAGSVEDIAIELSEKINGIVLVNVDSVGYYVNVTDGSGALKLNHLGAGSYDVTVQFLGDDKYNPQSNVTSFTVKAITEDDIKIDIDNENKTITIEVPENATGNVTVVIDGKNVTGEVINNTIVVNITDLLPGNHTIEVIYGDKNYTVYDNTTEIEIPKVDDYEFDVGIDVDGDNVEISVDLPEDVNGVVLVDVDGTGYYMNVTNGTGKLVLSDLDDGEHNVSIRYPGNDKYAEVKNSTSFTIEGGHTTPIEISAEDINVGENLTVDVTVPSDAKGSIVLEIDGNTYTAPINNGVAKFNIEGLDVGNYTVKATYSGDDKYPANSTSAVVEVSKVKDYPINVTVDGKDIIVDLPEDAQGNVTVVIDGKNYTAEVENGTAVINVPDLEPGEHNITVVYGDDKYSPESNSTVIDVPNKLLIDAPSIVKYYSGPERFYVYLEDMYGNKIANASISLTINGITYSRTTDENGTASIAINLPSGNYTVLVGFNGNDEFNATNVTSTIEVLPTIYGNDVFKVFRNGTQYYALFLDGNGNPLVNTDVSFNIHGVFYTRTTNATGWAKLNINLERGEYILTAINPVTGEMKSNNITVISRIVENYDLVKYYRNGTQYTARIVAKDGSYAGAGERVTFNIHGVIYNRYTDSNGYVTLNINLEPGDYIITAYYEDCAESNMIHVLPVLFTRDLEMNYKDGSQFIAHLLDGQGNPYPGQNINFNVNGVFYDRTTDANGDARLNINLQSGQYIITSSYNGESNSNTIVIH